MQRSFSGVKSTADGILLIISYYNLITPKCLLMNMHICRTALQIQEINGKSISKKIGHTTFYEQNRFLQIFAYFREI